MDEYDDIMKKTLKFADIFKKLKYPKFERKTNYFCLVDPKEYGIYTGKVKNDFFKKINDTHGHVKGDEVLAWLGQFITEQTRQNDIAFRFGGEEFMLLLAETRKREALHVCERIRRELARSSVAQLPVGCVTISVGLTACRLDEKDTFDSMSKRADAALYAAKDLGRNRVEVMG